MFCLGIRLGEVGVAAPKIGVLIAVADLPGERPVRGKLGTVRFHRSFMGVAVRVGRRVWLFVHPRRMDGDAR
jgi:hypothetical protein